MDRFTNTQLKIWVLEKLESNRLYRSDLGNPAIKQVYLQEIHNIYLPLECLSTLETISRRRNEILEKRKDLDFRKKYKKKKDK